MGEGMMTGTGERRKSYVGKGLKITNVDSGYWTGKVSGFPRYVDNIRTRALAGGGRRQKIEGGATKRR